MKNYMSTILVVEDDESIRECVCEILEIEGYDVVSESNGEDGLQRAITIMPDLMLCDVNMPRLNGLQTLKMLRNTDDIKSTPFVFLSALAEMSDLRNGMNLGADDYLIKPFDQFELLDVISQQLRKTKERKSIYTKEIETTYNEKVKQHTKEQNSRLNSAGEIQKVILPSNQYINTMFPDHFCYYNPKDPVSGDFYWIREKNGRKLVAVADCTGHGVSAALITMICYNMLNTAIERFSLRYPAEILNKVNELFLEFMNSNPSKSIGKGMDISMIWVDSEYNVIRYAGAKRPIYIVGEGFNPLNIDEKSFHVLKNEKNQSIYELKGSSCSIGNNQKGFEIKEQIFEYSNDDIVFLASDGYADQFGGTNNKKYRSKKLKELLLSNSEKSMKFQKQWLEESFDNWRGEEEQVDDVTVIGIRL